ncbi:phage terminase small subunit P27 family [Alsobacter sp. R-9]
MRGTKPATIRPGTSSVKSAPKAPAWLSKDAKAEWSRVVPVLVERRVLTDADLGCVEAYCVAIGRVREFERLIQSGDGDLLRLVRAQDKSTQTARQLAAELGLTPVSRSRPTMRDEDEDEDLAGLDL